MSPKWPQLLRKPIPLPSPIIAMLALAEQGLPEEAPSRPEFRLLPLRKCNDVLGEWRFLDRPYSGKRIAPEYSGYT